MVGATLSEPQAEEARRRAEEAGVANRVSFEVAGGPEFPGVEGGYDLVAFFDCFHDMGDPAGAAAHIRRALAGDGTWLLVEPAVASEGPIARIFSAASVGICTPSAQAQAGPYALGNQVTDEQWQSLLSEAGFSRFRRATETPLNRVFEVRK